MKSATRKQQGLPASRLATQTAQDGIPLAIRESLIAQAKAEFEGLTPEALRQRIAEGLSLEEFLAEVDQFHTKLEQAAP